MAPRRLFLLGNTVLDFIGGVMNPRGCVVRAFLLYVFVLSVAECGKRVRLPGRRIAPRMQEPIRESRKYNQTHRVVIHLDVSEDAESVARENGFRIKKALTGALEGFYIAERSTTLRDAPHSLNEDTRVKWWQDDQPQIRVKRQSQVKRPDPTAVEERSSSSWRYPSDPLFQDQWHLGGSSFRPAADLNVIPAWRDGYTGRGIVIGVVDDGLQKDHPDLESNYDPSYSHDFNDDDSDPYPTSEDSHGTSAAGVAAADRDTHCGVGVAYNAHLGGYQLLKSWTSDSTEAEALSHLCMGKNRRVDAHAYDPAVHILSCSWGPTDDAKHLVGPGPVTQRALQQCTEQGRDGKGTVYAWAGGNGRYVNDNSNYDGYANSIYTIAVAAIDRYGAPTWYSEQGANIHCCAPSSGDQLRIVTTDLKGRKGYSNNDCTFDFGGTSAAAPQLAGVVALMLDANIDLSYRDVMDILAKTGRDPNNPHNEPFIKNAAGFKHSHDLGFGLIDANAAVQQSLTRSSDQLLGTLVHFTTGWLPSPESGIDPEYSVVMYWEPDNIQQATNAIRRLEHVSVSVQISTPSGARCLELTLIGPSGVESELSKISKIAARNVNWAYTSVRHWGEPLVYDASRDVRSASEGKHHADEEHPSRWKVKIRNACAADVAEAMEVRYWKLDFYGTS